MANMDLYDDLEDPFFPVTRSDQPASQSPSISNEELDDLVKQNSKLSIQNAALKKNISCLYKTARLEIDRKDQRIIQLKKKIKTLRTESNHFRNSPVGGAIRTQQSADAAGVVEGVANTEISRVELTGRGVASPTHQSSPDIMRDQEGSSTADNLHLTDDRKLSRRDSVKVVSPTSLQCSTESKSPLSSATKENQSPLVQHSSKDESGHRWAKTPLEENSNILHTKVLHKASPDCAAKRDTEGQDLRHRLQARRHHRAETSQGSLLSGRDSRTPEMRNQSSDKGIVHRTPDETSRRSQLSDRVRETGHETSQRSQHSDRGKVHRTPETGHERSQHSDRGKVHRTPQTDHETKRHRRAEGADTKHSPFVSSMTPRRSSTTRSRSPHRRHRHGHSGNEKRHHDVRSDRRSQSRSGGRSRSRSGGRSQSRSGRQSQSRSGGRSQSRQSSSRHLSSHHRSSDRHHRSGISSDTQRRTSDHSSHSLSKRPRQGSPLVVARHSSPSVVASPLVTPSGSDITMVDAASVTSSCTLGSLDDFYCHVEVDCDYECSEQALPPSPAEGSSIEEGELSSSADSSVSYADTRCVQSEDHSLSEEGCDKNGKPISFSCSANTSSVIAEVASPLFRSETDSVLECSPGQSKMPASPQSPPTNEPDAAGVSVDVIVSSKDLQDSPLSAGDLQDTLLSTEDLSCEDLSALLDLPISQPVAVCPDTVCPSTPHVPTVICHSVPDAVCPAISGVSGSITECPVVTTDVCPGTSQTTDVCPDTSPLCPATSHACPAITNTECSTASDLTNTVTACPDLTNTICPAISPWPLEDMLQESHTSADCGYFPTSQEALHYSHNYASIVNSPGTPTLDSPGTPMLGYSGTPVQEYSGPPTLDSPGTPMLGTPVHECSGPPTQGFSVAPMLDTPVLRSASSPETPTLSSPGTPTPTSPGTHSPGVLDSGTHMQKSPVADLLEQEMEPHQEEVDYLEQEMKIWMDLAQVKEEVEQATEEEVDHPEQEVKRRVEGKGVELENVAGEVEQESEVGGDKGEGAELDKEEVEEGEVTDSSEGEIIEDEVFLEDPKSAMLTSVYCDSEGSYSHSERTSQHGEQRSCSRSLSGEHERRPCSRSSVSLQRVESGDRRTHVDARHVLEKRSRDLDRHDHDHRHRSPCPHRHSHHSRSPRPYHHHDSRSSHHRHSHHGSRSHPHSHSHSGNSSPRPPHGSRSHPHSHSHSGNSSPRPPHRSCLSRYGGLGKVTPH